MEETQLAYDILAMDEKHAASNRIQHEGRNNGPDQRQGLAVSPNLACVRRDDGTRAVMRPRDTYWHCSCPCIAMTPVNTTDTLVASVITNLSAREEA